MKIRMLIVAAVAAGCGDVSRPPAAAWTSIAPARPEGCAGGIDALAAAKAGSAICLEAGEYAGPIEVPAGVVLFGPREAVIKSDGTGTTVRLFSGSKLYGLTVDGSGGRFDLLDAAVHVTGEDAEVSGVKISGATFGILVEKARRVSIVNNEVIGPGGEAYGLRGDSIRLWETQGSTIAGNYVSQARDIVVWYSSNNLIRNNVVERSRYGIHLMYSHDNRIDSNVFRDDVVGIFVMYSRRISIEKNRISGAAGAAGIGIGLKDSGALSLRQNILAGNTTGLYFDSSPQHFEDWNVVAENELRLGDAGIVFLGGTERNKLLKNRFADNLEQVRVEGGSDALGAEWEGNSFDDYAGYDLDGDGIGDLPYELRSASAALIARQPALAFLRGSAAMFLLEAASRALPVFQPKLVLRDPKPEVRR